MVEIHSLHSSNQETQLSSQGVEVLAEQEMVNDEDAQETPLAQGLMCIHFFLFIYNTLYF